MGGEGEIFLLFDCLMLFDVFKVYFCFKFVRVVIIFFFVDLDEIGLMDEELVCRDLYGFLLLLIFFNEDGEVCLLLGDE